MAGSVNDNESYYDEEDDAPEAFDGSDDFAVADPRFISADPHRTLEPARDGFTANPAAKSSPEPVREVRSQSAVVKTTAVSPPDLGPCLYFGPAGQRCDRRATAGSFCARHQPKDAGAFGETRSISLPQMSKRALGAAGIIAVLWPLLFDLIRELLRLLR